MEFKIIYLWPYLLGIIIVVFFSGCIFFLAGMESIESTYSMDELKRERSTQEGIFLDEEIEVPVRLIIPKIHADADIEYVGITPLGAMEVPTDPKNVAWFELGVRPGQKGSAVIGGHSGWKGNSPAVFDDLEMLSKGDEIHIENKKGQMLIFVVRESREYKENEEAGDVFVSDDEKAHLNLITCDGIWNEASQSYSKRLVVFADRK